MKMSLFDTYCDEFGQMDFQRSQLGTGMSKKAQAKRFIQELHRRAEADYNDIFTRQQLRQVCFVQIWLYVSFPDVKLAVFLIFFIYSVLLQQVAVEIGMQSNFEDFLTTLNTQGYILKKGPFNIIILYYFFKYVNNICWLTDSTLGPQSYQLQTTDYWLRSVVLYVYLIDYCWGNTKQNLTKLGIYYGMLLIGPGIR